MVLDPDLTKEQSNAVFYCEGSQIISAGAGTGKTKVIKNKIVHLIENLGYEPENILALTFTNKAINNLHSKLEECLKEKASQINVHTFHSFCLHILNEFSGKVNLPPLEKFVDEATEAMLVGELVNRNNLFTLTFPHDPIKAFMELTDTLNKAKDELVTVDQFFTKVPLEVQTAKEMALSDKKRSRFHMERAEIIPQMAELYKLFLAKEQQRGFYDQSDLHRYLIEALIQDSEFQEELQERYRYILVDEFQDVNFAQISLCRLLTGPNSRICVVGDDDQAIYRFRGASFKTFEMFKEEFKETKMFELTKNYRSNMKILQGANGLIAANEAIRLSKERWLVGCGKPELDRWGKLRVCLSPDPVIQARHVVEDIEKKVKEYYADESDPYAHFAILYRTHGSSKDIIAELDRRAIPYEIVGGRDIFSTPQVNALFAVLRILVDVDDGNAFYRALSGYAWKVPFPDLYRLTQYRRLNNLSMLEAINDYLNVGGLSEEGTKELERVTQGIQELTEMIACESLDKLVRKVLILTGMHTNLLMREDDAAQEILIDLAALLNLVNDYVAINPQATLFELLEYLQFNSHEGMDHIGAEPAEHAVSCLTIHAAKGLEFDHVYLVGFSATNFPHIEKASKFSLPQSLWQSPIPPEDANLMEERRLFYVAMTRAKLTLTLAGLDCTLDPGKLKGRKKKSIFLDELQQIENFAEFAETLIWDALGEEKELERDLLLEGRDIFLDGLWQEISQAMRNSSDYNKNAVLEDVAEKSMEMMKKALWQGMMFRARELDIEPVDETSKSALAKALGLNPVLTEQLSKEIPHADVLRALPGKQDAGLALEEYLTLSYSSLKVYGKCPFQYRATQLLRLPSQINNDMAFGSAMHDAVRRFGEAYRSIGKLPDEHFWTESLTESFSRIRFERYVDRKNSLRNGEGGLQSLYQEALSQFGPPVENEKQFSYSIDGHVVNGRMDWVGELGDGLWIIDFKSSSYDISKANTESGQDLQLGIYALAAEHLWSDRKVKKTSYVWLDKSAGKARRWDCECIDSLKEFARNSIKEYVRGILAHEFEATPGEHCRECGINDLCPYGF